MRKISKISLVAAVAVAGFSTANAQPLEQAIKDVEVSGSVVYRYNNYDNNGITPAGDQTESNNYKIGLNLASKVNDYVKFNSRFIVGQSSDSGFASLNSKKTPEGTSADKVSHDGNADVTLSNAYFGLTAIPNTVVNIGKQGLATPYTVATDINGNEQTGTGILALTTVGALTAGIGYFNNTNLDASGDGAKATTTTPKWGTKNNVDGGSDVYVATLQGDLDFVKLEGWYLGLQNTFDTYTLAATSKLDLAKDAKINLEARYVDLELDKKIAQGDSAENSMFRFAVDGKFNIVNARLAYTKTGKHGGLTATDQDAKNTSLAWNATSLAYANADFYQAALGADILDNLNFTMNYANLTSEKTDVVGALNKNDAKIEEVYGQLTYKMSKNLNTYVRYGNISEEKDSDGKESKDQDMGRIQIAYSF